MPDDTPPFGPDAALDPAPPGLVSVVVACCGQLEYTRLCVPAVVRFSRPPVEVIGVDAGSLDGTAEYWDGVRAAAPIPVAVVRAAAEADLTAAIRAGLARARGEFVALVDNDTIVPDGWLTQLVALAATDSAVGMVAPMTTYGPGHQVVWPVPYQVGAGAADDPAGADGVWGAIGRVNEFARRWRAEHLGQWSEADRLGGGCVLVRRAALAAAGPLPAAPLRFFDAEGLSRRVRAAGYRLACCRDLFVHSFGSRGFAPAPPDAG